MNYADIKQYDVANGPGIRVSLFVSGCRHYCKNCFNQEAWDFQYGQSFTDETIETIIRYMQPSYVKGLTLLGGEPLERVNQQGLLPLLRKVRSTYPDKNIWCFTGFDYERDVIGSMYANWEETRELLSLIDVLVDGEFMEDKKDLSLRFKGSSNQRTILVPESLAAGCPILWDDRQPEY
jgi:anaerobic ribonucleoside-triphosphate reductase activating protein